MNKVVSTIVALWVVSLGATTPSMSSAQSSPSNQTYFNGYSVDGGPIRADSCGVNYGRRGWVVRDLGGGGRVEVGINYEARKPLTTTLLFRFSDEKNGKLEIFPEEVKLYISPSAKLVKPTSIERKPFDPNDIQCDILQHGEWITLEFPVTPEEAEQVAVMLPLGTVAKGESISVGPLRFDRIDFSSDGSSGQVRSPINPPVLPRMSPRFGAFESAAAVPRDIKGTWIVDSKETRELIAKSPLPFNAEKLAQWFGLGGGYTALMIIELEGNTAKIKAFNGSKSPEFQRVSDQETESVYAPFETSSSNARTLAVSILKNGNIRIVPSDRPEMAYLRWKPGDLKSSADFDETVNAWVASVQSIVRVLTPPIAPSVTKLSTSQIALDEAVRLGVIRKATQQDVKAFRDAYVEKKYTKLSLTVPANETALSVSNVDISRAYVVLKKFTYPPDMIDKNRVVFFLPKGVSEPDGSIGHSAIYVFETLTVSCTLARTGGMSC